MEKYCLIAEKKISNITAEEKAEINKTCVLCCNACNVCALTAERIPEG